MRAVPALAIAVAAAALYLTRGVLDQAVTADGPVRYALLPPWPIVGGFGAIGLLGLLWLDRRTVPRGTSTGPRAPLGHFLLPLLGLAALLVPFLPVLPDAAPALQILAGPLKAVVWLVVLAQLAWVLWQARLLRADWLQHATVRHLAIAIGVATTLAAGLAASRLGGSILYPAGDEPHYLVIAQSLWRDGDLAIENNHVRGDYREYYPRALDPHYLTRGRDGQIYSIHPIGMPVMIAPIYAIGGYWAVVGAFVLMAGAAGALAWHVAAAATGSAGAATFAWAAVALTSPFLFNAFAIYPEIPAALAVAAGYMAIAATAPPTVARALVVGLACAALPWLSTKYAPMSAALAIVGLWRVWRTLPRPGGMAAPAAAIVLPYAMSLAGWFPFFYVVWGTPLPQAPYGNLVQTEIPNLLFGAPGLLFDQEYGLLPYAPVYLLAGSGLAAMWRGTPDTRRSAIEIAVIFAALLGTVGAFRIWWGGSASPGRPLTSGLLLLAVPMAFAFRASLAGGPVRALQHLLLWASVGIAGILLFAQNGFLTANGRDGTSTLLEFLSPRWPAWTLLPSFIYHEAWTALAHTAVWLVLCALAAQGLARVRVASAGSASLAALGTAAAVLALALVVMPRLPLSPAWPGIDLRARGRLPLLDEFDRTARPVILAYRPLQRISSDALLAAVSLVAEPGLRTDPQPVRVLHNGRFSLPAGAYRLDVEWSGARNGEQLGLQLGRSGDAWQSWAVEPRPGTSWSIDFSLPLDVGFVGVRGSPELERVVSRIRIVPTAVVDVSRRPRSEEVIGASRSGGISVFYYDRNVFPEALGFWTWGGRQTRVAVDRPDPSQPLTLRMHSGPVPNRVRLSAGGWSTVVDLEAERRVDIEVPPSSGPLRILDVATDRRFVPRERDPRSSDDRALGAWVEVVR